MKQKDFFVRLSSPFFHFNIFRPYRLSRCIFHSFRIETSSIGSSQLLATKKTSQILLRKESQHFTICNRINRKIVSHFLTSKLGLNDLIMRNNLRSSCYSSIHIHLALVEKQATSFEACWAIRVCSDHGAFEVVSSSPKDAESMSIAIEERT